MLVSHRYQFIYTKTFKTAGTSIESYFERFCLPDGQWEQCHTRDEYESETGIIGYRGANEPAGKKWWNHMPAALVRQRLGEEVWNRYFKFCAVRNPFEKCISAFEHLGAGFSCNHGAGSPCLAAAAGMEPEQHRFYCWLQCEGPPRDRDMYLIDGRFCMDDVIRYESLEVEMARICRKVGVDWDRALLPSFKRGIRREEATAEKLYTHAARRFVAHAFAPEFAHFQYEFPQ